MNRRISFVKGIVITSVAENAQIRIGDTNEISATANILAVQQLETPFDPNEDESLLKSFQRPAIQFPQFPDEVTKITFHEQPFIKTGPIRIIGVATSSTIHVGSICHMYGQANVINIRQISKDGKTIPAAPSSSISPTIGPIVPLSLR